MKVLLLNQTFHPDVVATGQYLAEVAVALAERGHTVSVMASRRAYDEPDKFFPKRETWRGVEIHRIATTRFGKGARWRRAAEFASFIVACCWRLLWLPRPDAVVALTSPPLISFVGAWYAKLRGAKFFYWVMDLNPDEALAAGWLREGTLLTRLLDRMSKFSLRRAEKIIALDRFMRARIEGKGIAPEKIAVIPPWSHDKPVRFDAGGREKFRSAHGLSDKFVVMYSGNHSPCHPLDTLMEAARRLAGDPRYVFLFVGGGSEWRRIQEKQKVESRKQKSESGKQKMEDGGRTTDQGPRTTDYRTRNTEHGTRNILCFPYQPLDELSASLSAADLHVVVMGERFVGTIHPCKIYNVLNVGAPILCIGPGPSHLTGILDALKSEVCASIRHGEVEACVREIQRIAATKRRGEEASYAAVAGEFSQKALLSRLIRELECSLPK